MYVIGINDWRFIDIKFNQLYDGRTIIQKVERVTYNKNLKDAYLTNSHDYIVGLLQEIRNNRKLIEFQNENIFAHVLGENKLNIDDLKIYELVAIELKGE